MMEPGVLLVGGHCVEYSELNYGLSVTGFVHPDRVLTKKNLNAGDRLVLTKPLGTGVINTAIKGGVASVKVIDKITRLMATLNRNAAEVMKQYSVHACTDITGFGLLGHLAEMVDGSGLGAVLDSKKIPILSEAMEYAAMGMLPAGANKNKIFRESMVEFYSSVNPLIRDLLFDPQTSGGLLICIDRDDTDELVEELIQKGSDASAVIGEVVSAPQEKIVVN